MEKLPLQKCSNVFLKMKKLASYQTVWIATTGIKQACPPSPQWMLSMVRHFCYGTFAGDNELKRPFEITKPLIIREYLEYKQGEAS